MMGENSIDRPHGMLLKRLMEDDGCHPLEIMADELRAQRRGHLWRGCRRPAMLYFASPDWAAGLESFRLKFSVSLQKNLDLAFGFFQFFSAGT